MSAPTGTPELNEVIDAGFGVALRIKASLAAGGPGGKQVTIDEMLDTVTDGEMKQSTRDLVEAIASLINREPADIFDLIPTIAEALLDWLAVLRNALADGRVQPGEILQGVTDGKLRPELEKAIAGAEKIPAELKGLDMMSTFILFQRIASYLPRLLQPSS